MSRPLKGQEQEYTEQRNFVGDINRIHHLLPIYQRVNVVGDH